ncbi:ATP-dependent helicase OS=Lysinibacillus sphaericus OX=1421 GN=LS41612_14840 PE=4 SV=1 [Lysinibacillus sphaericus]
MNAFIPLFIQCDASDVAVVPQVKATHNNLPTFFVYDKYPGGIGLSEKVYDLWEDLLTKTMNHVVNGPCEFGRPSCIWPQNALVNMKRKVKELLQILY